MNSEKYHPSVSGNKYEHMWTNIGGVEIRESKTVKLLSITIDNELKFDEHIRNACIKAQRKLTALMGIRKGLDINKLKILFKTVFESQFINTV